MRTLLATYKPCTDKDILPYTAEDINSVMIDFMMGQLPEQYMLTEGNEIYESSGGVYSVDMFLKIFGEPQTMKEFGENYLFYYLLKDSRTLVISVNAFGYVMNRMQINDYDAYE